MEYRLLCYIFVLAHVAITIIFFIIFVLLWVGPGVGLMNFAEKLNNIYFNKRDLNDEEMASSRNLSIYEGCTARSILTLTSGSFLVGFANYLGASNQISGLISAIPVLAGIITVFSPVLFERLENRKLITVLFCFIGRLLLGLMILIPFINISGATRITILIATFLVANLFLASVMPSALAWVLNITPEGIRGAYYGRRESIVLGVVTIVTLVMGQVLDVFDRAGHQLNGFVVLYIFVIITTMVNLIIFSGIKEQPNKITKNSISIINIFSKPIKSKKYMKVSLLMAIWNFGYQLAFPFTSVYMISTLKLGYGLITIMAVLASITSVISVKFWGRLADRKSWVHLTNLMLLLQVASFLIWFFINGHTVMYLIAFAHILSGAAIAGINISMNNLQYSFSPPENKMVFMGFSSAVNGIIGFLGTLVGSYFITLTGKYSHSHSLGKLSVGIMQLLFVIAGVMLFTGMIVSRSMMKNELNMLKQ